MEGGREGWRDGGIQTGTYTGGEEKEKWLDVDEGGR